MPMREIPLKHALIQTFAILEAEKQKKKILINMTANYKVELQFSGELTNADEI